MSSFFHEIVRGENGHTALLKSLFERDARVTAAILNQHLGTELSLEQAAQLDFRYQPGFQGVTKAGLVREEIPDLVICGEGFWCVVEIKVDPWLSLQESQLEGYPACFKSHQGYLLFIVPKSSFQDGLIQKVPNSAARLVRKASWNSLIDTLEKVCNQDDQICLEIVHFWKERFEIMRMNSDDVARLKSWQKESFIVFRKAMKLVDETRRLMASRYSGFTVEQATSIQEYGFYLKLDRQFILWFGIWDAAHAPFAVGVKKEWLPIGQHVPSDMYRSGVYELRDLQEQSWSSAEGLSNELEQLLLELGHVS